MSQSHRRSARVTMERQRYGVVAEALLSNMHLILHRYWEEGDMEGGYACLRPTEGLEIRTYLGR